MTKNSFKVATLAVLATAGLAIAADVQITGAGATFPNPIYGKWFNEFTKVRKDVQINYQSIGSGAGIKQLVSGTVDFGASDRPMTDGDHVLVDGGVLRNFVLDIAGARPTWTPANFIESTVAEIRSRVDAHAHATGLVSSSLA